MAPIVMTAVRLSNGAWSLPTYPTFTRIYRIPTTTSTSAPPASASDSTVVSRPWFLTAWIVFISVTSLLAIAVLAWAYLRRRNRPQKSDHMESVEGDMKKDPEWQTNNNSHLPEIDGEIYPHWTKSIMLSPIMADSAPIMTEEKLLSELPELRYASGRINVAAGVPEMHSGEAGRMEAGPRRGG
ncbi:hypothetical protein C8J57DRAFT_1311215 [Mycena rebaudengoi]|nr:hypothetical protein C8J57DRAFT_58853 [Mycena rebaudengoi]KAJ7275618.1 hypothetical protein C8J57DRAFT_1311215 [Mycena rebaudengoi]